jgi:DnaJ-class molecular chaperone
MADFEPMPVGTRAKLAAVARLLRAYEREHRAKAFNTATERSKADRIDKAQRNADAAAELEALLAMPDFSNGDRIILASGQSCQETRSGEWTMTFDEPVEMVPDLSGHGRVMVRGEPRSVEEFDAPCPTCEGRGVYDSKPIPPDTGPAMEFECYACDGTGRRKPPQVMGRRLEGPDFRASVLELTPAMQLDRYSAHDAEFPT